jgi:hypothetical protein
MKVPRFSAAENMLYRNWSRIPMGPEMLIHQSCCSDLLHGSCQAAMSSTRSVVMVNASLMPEAYPISKISSKNDRT